MKISELPEDVRKKALEYQKSNIYYNYLNNEDDLIKSFCWIDTKEGYDYWREWSLKENNNPLEYFETITNPYVKKPKQYQIGIDTFERAEANLTKEEILAICKFNIDKYNWRKKDQDKEDFKKIIDYANWALKNI